MSANHNNPRDHAGAGTYDDLDAPPPYVDRLEAAHRDRVIAGWALAITFGAVVVSGYMAVVPKKADDLPHAKTVPEVNHQQSVIPFTFEPENTITISPTSRP